MIPREGVDRKHTFRAAPLELEAEEAIPGADVEHGHARQALGDLQKPQSPAKPSLDMPRPGVDTVAEIKRRMKPVPKLLNSSMKIQSRRLPLVRRNYCYTSRWRPATVIQLPVCGGISALRRRS